MVGRILTVLIFLFSVTALAQAAELNTKIVPERGTLDDSFLLTVESREAVTGRPEIGSSEDFDVRFAGSQQQFSMVNGVTTQTTSYLFELKPKETGTLTTPRITLSTRAGELQSKRLAVEVSAPAPSSGDPRIIQELSSLEAYVGEPIILRIRLLSSSRVLKGSFEDLTYDGFWKERLGKQRSYQARIGTSTFNIHELRHVLFPLRDGTLEIPQRILEAAVAAPSQRGRSPFGGLFSFGPTVRGKSVRLRSNALAVDVKPLPPLPDTFKELRQNIIPVGATTVDLQLGSRQAELGESIPISLMVRSRGNIRPLKDPLSAQFDERLRFYPESPKLEVIEQKDGIVFQQIFRGSLVPQTDGLLLVPASKLLFFNPSTSRYELITTKETAITVAPDPDFTPEPTTAALPSLEKEEQSRSVMDLFLDRFSTSVLIGGASAAGLAVLLLILLFLWRWSKQKRIARLREDVREAKGPHELLKLFRRMVSERYEGFDQNIRHQSLFEELQQWERDERFLLALREVYDTIVDAIYAGPSAREDRVWEEAFEPLIRKLTSGGKVRRKHRVQVSEPHSQSENDSAGGNGSFQSRLQEKTPERDSRNEPHA